MTEEQKEILIEKLLDTSSSLSDKEIDAILQDDELRDIYEASVLVGSVSRRQPEFDMEAEWALFRPRICRKPSSWRWVMRVATIFFAVLLISGITSKIIDRVFTPDNLPEIAKTGISEKFNDTTPGIPAAPGLPDTSSTLPATSPPPSAPSHHIAKVEIPEPQPIVSQEEIDRIVADIDIDEYLRIQQARIDNDLALLAAADYIEEYDKLETILDAIGVNNPELEMIVKKVTVE